MYEILWLTFVAVLWGGTNPFIKKGGAGIEEIKERNAIRQFLAELKFLFFNWKYLIPFLLNQCGSVLYYLTLATMDLSLAVPVTNSLTFLFTLVSGKFLGEDVGGKETYLGMLLVLSGVCLCMSDRS
ncbi:transmembrane protein 234-like [Anneissia japonica]|uniref:transmembrane protein 234-like n=1 Tax=Anneissia japonica TaxID=1529436 RepID=UPI0014254E38|nr:transmembrane protein 234-like [Anneissia japonica]XP_033116513.1 transmembrane protein 234-like [Anneissia japonica]